MQLYDMLEESNRQITARIDELEAVDRENGLERNIRFERLQASILQGYEAKRRTFYAALLQYPETYEVIDYVQHLQVQVMGLLDALVRERIGTDEWEGLFTTLKEWVQKVIALEQEKVVLLAQCYFTLEDQERMMEELDLEVHVLDRNDRIENEAEEGFNEEYVGYKKALDTPGKSHLPPKRNRMGSA